MKVTCLLFLLLTVSCTPSMQATSSAALHQQTPAESSANEKSAKPDGAHPRDDHPQDADHAVLPNDEKPKKEGIPDEKRNLRGTLNKTHPRSDARITTTHRPKQAPISQKRLLGNTTNLHQLASDKSRGSAKEGLIQNEAVKKVQHIRSTSFVRPNVASLNPSLNNVRHRGPNPVVVGGSANSGNSNTGAINGTGMHRRP
jgi:hypothetical protein